MDKEEAVKLLQCMKDCVPMANAFIEAIDFAVAELEK